MNVEAFASDDFDPVKWLNTLWVSESRSGDEGSFVRNNLTVVQEIEKSVSAEMEESVAAMLGAGGRAAREAGALRGEALALQQLLAALERRLRDVDAHTGHTVRHLQRFHYLKGQLERAAAALQEADRWRELAAKLTRHLDEPALATSHPDLLHTVNALTASLHTLSLSPDFQLNKLTLDSLFDKLEATIESQLKNGLMQKDMESTKNNVQLYKAMGRLEKLWKIWQQVEYERLSAQWSSVAGGDRTGVLTPGWRPLRELHSSLSTHARQNYEWVSDVLNISNPLEELVTLYSSILNTVEPSPSKVMSALIKHCTDAERVIEMLIDMKTDIDEFSQNIKCLLDTNKHLNTEVSLSSQNELIRSMYSPLKHLLPQYKEYQSQVLTAFLQSSAFEEVDSLERAKCIKESIEKSENWLNTARLNSKKIAGIAIYPYLIVACEEFIAAHCSRMSSNLRLLDSEFCQHKSKVDPSFILSRLFPVSVVLSSASKDLLNIVSEFSESIKEEVKKNYTSMDSNFVLLDDESERQMRSWKEEEVQPLEAAIEDVRRVCKNLSNLSLKIVFEPVGAQLEKLQWGEEDAGPGTGAELPDFGRAPSECMVEVGQYLVTLVQHVEGLVGGEGALALLGAVCEGAARAATAALPRGARAPLGGQARADLRYLARLLDDLAPHLAAPLLHLADPDPDADAEAGGLNLLPQ